MALRTWLLFSTCTILTFIIALNIDCIEGSKLPHPTEIIRLPKCKKGEHLGCVSPPGSPCAEDTCNVEKRLNELCLYRCKHGCNCKKGLYRRMSDRQCVPKSECNS
ncbi:hypothetical protein MRX96_048334 [Rhipicephalus microplus]|uniref:TIL domain-containing protein n=1 Tax=Rhipicephalus microplus TaxID=6941 RepID=A0A6G5A626_RHIMP